MVNTPPGRLAPRPMPNPKPGDRLISGVTLPHESWLAPGVCKEDPRIEEYADDRVIPGRGGDEKRVPVIITRCIECGAQQIKEK